MAAIAGDANLPIAVFTRTHLAERYIHTHRMTLRLIKYRLRTKPRCLL